MDLVILGRTLNVSLLPVICTLLLLAFGLLYCRRQYKPPGPWGLPFLGLLPFLKEGVFHIQLQNYTKKYGSIYSFTYAGNLFIHLGSLKAVKEAFVTKGDCFADRYAGFNILTSLFGEGMVVENGERWRVLRKFFINAFREHGVTSVKDYMSGPILDSVNATVDDLRAKNGAPFDIISILTFRSSEILRRILFNDDGISQEELKKIIEEYEKVVPIFINRNSLLNGNFAKYLIFPFTKSYNIAYESQMKAISILKVIIARHESSFDKNNVRNIIDSYIKERNERRSKGDPTAEYFTDNALAFSLIQFVGDGITAVSVFIAYFIKHLLDLPDEQEKICKEMEEVLGTDRQPTLDDKNKLHYLNAFVQEVQRTMDFLNIFANVVCTKETTIDGHKIPKDSFLLLNVWSCNRDPSVFDEPDEFRPSRYITESGRRKAEAPLTFGVGKRSCIGEPFVMMQTFLFLATLIKNFRLSRPEGTATKPFPDIVLEICAQPRK